MARLPTPGSDDNIWGDVLNEYLEVTHNADGTQKDGTIGTDALTNSAVTQPKIASNAITNVKVAAAAAIDQSKIAGLTSDLASKAASVHTHTPAQVGLGNVDNTSDVSKPVSSATQTALNLKMDKVAARTDSDTGPVWRTDFTGTLDTGDKNVAEHYVNGTMTAWLNEWGAMRGTTPYADALFRAIRTNSDTIGAGAAPAFHLNDRRSGAVSPHLWARTWAGTLLRQGVAMADTYVTTYANPTDDPNYANLPTGTHIVVVEP